MIGDGVRRRQGDKGTRGQGERTIQNMFYGHAARTKYPTGTLPVNKTADYFLLSPNKF